MEVFRANCEICGRVEIHKERRLMIEAAPDALTVHLRRYQLEHPEEKDGLDGPSSTGKIPTLAPLRQFKMDEPVSIPRRLNLSRYYTQLPGTPKITL